MHCLVGKTPAEFSFSCQEDAVIDIGNVDDMKFVFEEPNNITNNIRKSGKPQNGSTQFSGKIAFSSMTCIYPDQTTSVKVLIDDCIVQYRELPARYEYGDKYVTIGFPIPVIKKIKGDARSRSSTNAVLKEKVQELYGYYWMDCNTEQMDSSSCAVVLQEDDDAIVRTGSLKKILTGYAHNLKCIMLLTVSLSQVTKNDDEDLNMSGGKFNLALKPSEIWAIRIALIPTSCTI